MLALPCAAADVIEVGYTGTDSVGIQDDRNLFFIELLKQSLARSGKPYKAVVRVRGATHARQMQMVVDGLIDVLWDAPGPEVDKRLMAIEIPIDKGLIGWRIFFINKEDQPLFSKTTTEAELKKIPLGQVKYWHDTSILRANHFDIVETPTYNGTFKMLMSKRFNYFPRSISEIWSEQKNQQSMLSNVVIEKNLVLHYPIAYFYHVSQANKVLAQDIQHGLEAMLRDGSFDKLFEEFNGELIAKANLKNRHVIHIKNPYMSDETYRKFEHFWFNPETYDSTHPDSSTSDSKTSSSAPR
ncbi:hypothetical protein GCM10011613_21580 [Cellvibrio zantedeschiae]|uniref:Solute-binding protein family 3/N-terminal domain-containing protein n=1 Tax=Cellvibrio zantedeschiae TaxID=1237077 RepID=A0ABQ3B3V7_9GAMM|nr:hypothetical protein GCM10011613_21580 [Cellvibrio zantedeschiae]